MIPIAFLASPWAPVAKWGVLLLVIVAPWVGLYYYVPLAKSLKVSLAVSQARTESLEREVASLQQVKQASNEATEKMRVARDRAEAARSAAQEAAALKAISHDAKIAALQHKLATTIVTAENECEALKRIVDSYTIGMLNEPTPTQPDSSLRTDPSEMRYHPPDSPG